MQSSPVCQFKRDCQSYDGILTIMFNVCGNFFLFSFLDLGFWTPFCEPNEYVLEAVIVGIPIRNSYEPYITLTVTGHCWKRGCDMEDKDLRKWG